MSEVKGPRSYFPAIEKKYGEPIEHWMRQLESVVTDTHMQQVGFLKKQFGFGHGHANALVAVFRAERDL